MIDTFYIGAYWSSRKNKLDEVVLKTILTLKKIAELDEQFNTWYELGMSRKKSLEKKVVVEPGYIEMLYRKNIKKGEIDDFGYTSHFFSLGLWSGHKSDEASNISFNVGGEFNTDNLSNSCVINIPIEGEARERLLKLDRIKSLVDVLIQNWNPDSVVLVSQELKKALSTINEIGWLTYAKDIKYNPKISNKVVFEKYENGHLFYLNLANNDCYDYSLTNELQPLKEIIK